MITVAKAPPFATVQDLGWRTGRAMGLPRSGAMDPLLLGQANALVGNPSGAAGIEWALGSGALVVEAPCEVTILGAGRVDVDGSAADPGHPVLRLEAGARIAITPRPDRRFLYLAVRGGIDVPRVMGSRSTYLPGGFGGLEGRRLRAGDRLPVGPALHAPLGAAVHPKWRPDAGSGPGDPVVLRFSAGPQWDRFDESARRTLVGGSYTVAAESDRMGYRLVGPPVPPKLSATLPSEAACPGAIQLPDGGQPIVLMVDGPTVGGYPKIGVILATDLPLLAQLPPGRIIRFRQTETDESGRRMR